MKIDPRLLSARPSVETRLRKRIDVLTDERDEARKQRGLQRPEARGNRCVYCGYQSGTSLACPSHRDLLALDPAMQA